MGYVSDEVLWSQDGHSAFESLSTFGTHPEGNSVTIRLVKEDENGQIRYAEEVPAARFRMYRRSCNGFSFLRLEVAVEPIYQTQITESHSLVITRYPYTALWASFAPFRRGSSDPDKKKIPENLTTLEEVQRFLDFECPVDLWEEGDDLVAGVSLPLNVLDFGDGKNKSGGYYILGACQDPEAIEESLLKENQVERVFEWTKESTHHPLSPLPEMQESRLKRSLLMSSAIRQAMAGPSHIFASGGNLEVNALVSSIHKQLVERANIIEQEVRNTLSLAKGSFRHFTVEAPVVSGGLEAIGVEKRLVYVCTAPGVITSQERSMPRTLKKGEILTRLRSLTLCCTDVSNLHGLLGHGHESEQILGHENCNEVVESRVEGINEGDLVVPLGDDWLGLAEYEMFKPVLPDSDPRGISLVYADRGGYFDPDSDQHIKAICVVNKWRSGISLIEPLTHVYTYFATSPSACIARSTVVLGGGACGLFFCLFTKLFAASHKVTLLDIIDERLEFATRHGLADVVINPMKQADKVEQIINDTKGAYADVVFDALPGKLPEGTPLSRKIGMRMLRPNGEYILYSASEEGRMPMIEMLAKAPRFHFAPYDSRIIDFSQRAELMKKIFIMIDAGLINPEIFIARQVGFRDLDDIQALFLEYGKTPEIKVEILT